MNYTIAQAAKKMNLTIYTIRYYDREGLLTNVKRDKSGNRVFTKDDMEMLSLICCLKNTGMPIKKIKQFTDWHNEGSQTLHIRNDMLENHKEDILKQIDDLKNIFVRLIESWIITMMPARPTIRTHQFQPAANISMMS